jgi:surface protein
MEGMFQLCDRLTELDLRNFDTSNVTGMDNMFYNCGFLTKLNLSSFDMSKVVGVSNFMYNTKNLQEIQSFKNLGKGYTAKSNNYSSYTLDLSSCNQLTHESLIDIITNGLYDLNLTYNVANGGTLYTQKLVLGSTNKAKLTADEIAIATNKGWTVS